MLSSSFCILRTSIRFSYQNTGTCIGSKVHLWFIYNYLLTFVLVNLHLFKNLKITSIFPHTNVDKLK